LAICAFQFGRNEACGTQQIEQAFDGGGFAGTVAAKKAVATPRFDAQV
jgi:hypothetical protein